MDNYFGIRTAADGGLLGARSCWDYRRSGSSYILFGLDVLPCSLRTGDILIGNRCMGTLLFLPRQTKRSKALHSPPEDSVRPRFLDEEPGLNN